jgi:hypothetical protein
MKACSGRPGHAIMLPWSECDKLHETEPGCGALTAQHDVGEAHVLPGVLEDVARAHGQQLEALLLHFLREPERGVVERGGPLVDGEEEAAFHGLDVQLGHGSTGPASTTAGRASKRAGDMGGLEGWASGLACT